MGLVLASVPLQALMMAGAVALVIGGTSASPTPSQPLRVRPAPHACRFLPSQDVKNIIWFTAPAGAPDEVAPSPAAGSPAGLGICSVTRQVDPATGNVTFGYP